MSDEIKEILDKLKNYDNYKYRSENGRSYKEIEGWEIDLLLDYITNLQEENQKLKKLCDKYEEEHGTRFIEWVFDKTMYEDYKSRNEKAIEWVKKNMYYFPRPYELLNILNGEMDE